MPSYIVNAKKTVQLEQTEIEAENMQDAARKYLLMAKAGEIGVSDHEWWALAEGDLEIERPTWSR